MMPAADIRKWLDTLPADSQVAIDDGALSLVVVAPDGSELDAFCEVGAVPLADGTPQPPAAFPADVMEPTAIISTAHLAQETADALDDWALGNGGRWHLPVTYQRGEYGWLVLVPQADGEDCADLANMPAELAALIRAARTQGLVWLGFDRDAATLDGFEVFEW